MNYEAVKQAVMDSGFNSDFELPLNDAKLLLFLTDGSGLICEWADSVRQDFDVLAKAIDRDLTITFSTFGSSQTSCKVLFYGHPLDAEELKEHVSFSLEGSEEVMDVQYTQFDHLNAKIDKLVKQCDHVVKSVEQINVKLTSIEHGIVNKTNLESDNVIPRCSTPIQSELSVPSTSSSSSSEPDCQIVEVKTPVIKYRSKTKASLDLETYLAKKRADYTWIKMVRNIRIENVRLNAMRKLRSVLICGPKVAGKFIRRVARRLYGLEKLKNTKMIDPAARYKVPTDRERKRSFTTKEVKTMRDALSLIDKSFFKHHFVWDKLVRTIVNQYGIDIKNGHCAEDEDTDHEEFSDDPGQSGQTEVRS